MSTGPIYPQTHRASSHGSSKKATRSTRSWQMLVRRRCVSSKPVSAAIDIQGTIPQDFEAAKTKALKVGAKKFFLEVCRSDMGLDVLGLTGLVPLLRISGRSLSLSLSIQQFKQTASMKYVIPLNARSR